MIARLLNPGLIVAGVMTICAVLVLVAAYSYQGISGTFPQLVGWIFLGLALLELAVQSAAAIRPGQQSESRSGRKSSNASVVKEIKAFGWLAVLLLSLYLMGFLISTPLYVFAFLRFSGRLSLKMSAAVAGGAIAFVYVVFVQLLEYKLFPGVLLMG